MLSAAAFAQDGGDCSALPSPLYVPGTTVARPFFARIAPRLAEGDGGFTLVYQGKGSCAALSQVTPGGPMTGTASYWERANLVVAPILFSHPHFTSLFRSLCLSLSLHHVNSLCLFFFTIFISRYPFIILYSGKELYWIFFFLMNSM